MILEAKQIGFLSLFVCLFVTGPWTKEEERLLLEAVRRYRKHYQTRTRGSRSTSEGGEEEEVEVKEEEEEEGDGGGVSWDTVSKAVGTRNALQCRQKWLLELGWRSQGGEGGRWGTEDDARLLRALSGVDDAECEEDVDWAGLGEGWPAGRSQYYLRMKWTLLRRNVPGYRIKTFQGVCFVPLTIHTHIHTHTHSENLDHLLQDSTLL